MMAKKKNLKDIDTKSLFNAKKIYINDDLTKLRAEIAAKARKLKKDGKIGDTWNRDGIIFVKDNSEHIIRVTKVKGLEVFER